MFEYPISEDIPSFPHKIKIVDDSVQSGKLLRSKVKDAAIKHKIDLKKIDIELITPELKISRDLESFVGYIQKSETDLVICDHILNQNGFANFYGSQLVAILYEHEVPCILVTQNIDYEDDTLIKRQRRHIPVFLTRSQLESNEIYKGFLKSHSEISLHHFSPDRRPHKTIIRVINIIKKCPFPYLSLIIPSRDPDTIITLPSNYFSNIEIDKLQPGDRLVAEVNTGAFSDYDLYFSNVEYVGRREKFEVKKEYD